MKDFDITSILDFQPPMFICPACRGTYLVPGFRGEDKKYIADSCPVCKVRYVHPSWDDNPPSTQTMLGLGGYRIKEGDMLAHAKSLAKIIESSKGKRIVSEPKPWPTMRLLLEMLSRGKYSEIVWLPMGRIASTSTNADALTGLPNTYAKCN